MNSYPFSFSSQIIEKAAIAEGKAQETFKLIDELEQFNSMKVLKAFIDNGITAAHLSGTTGYGYSDMGRDALERVFAQAVGAEDAIIRHNFASGTHTIAVALFGVLRPGDTMLSVTGTPYDTLHAVIGLGENDKNQGSLKDWGVNYEQVELLETGAIDIDACVAKVKGAKIAYFQRSRGYTLRPSLSVAEIEKAAKTLKNANPEVLIVVDNCYGEFVEMSEPCEHEADLIMGSLIKNPGGGIAKTGGYIAGRADLVEMCSYRLTTPATGKEIGCSLDELRNMYLGLFMAPTVVASALKTAVFAAALYEDLGYKTTPTYNQPRYDIIQSICLETPQALCQFCKGIQLGSPIDSRAVPEPWDMPGYDSKVIMAAGAFTMGSSIELSADGPMREPYAVWLQGGLTYPTGKAGIMLSADEVLRDKKIESAYRAMSLGFM